MTTVLDSQSHLHNYYQWLLSLSDKRTKGWPLVDSPSIIAFFILSYLLVIKTGQAFMKNRKPFKLNSVLIPYNFAMASLNFYIFYQTCTAASRLQYSFLCQLSTESYHPDELQIARALWWCFLSKLLEFCDTFFFILRKKDSQLTVLHVYHHTTTLFFSWIAVKWFPSGSVFVPMSVNCLIHVVMYSYYGLSAFGPRVVKYLWWKKYLTILQLLQFAVLLLLAVNGHINGCDFPLWIKYTAVAYMASFIVLFGNFYWKAYMERGRQIFFGMDIGCGQGNTYIDKSDHSLSSNHKVGTKIN